MELLKYLFIGLLFFLLQCESSESNNKIELNNEAAKLLSQMEVTNTELDSAITLLEKAIQIDSNYSKAWNNMLEAYERKYEIKKDSENANHLIDDILFIQDKLIGFSESPLLLIKQAKFYEKAGNIDSANKNYHKALIDLDNRLREGEKSDVVIFLKVYILCEKGHDKELKEFVKKYENKINKSDYLSDFVFNKDSVDCQKVLNSYF